MINDKNNTLAKGQLYWGTVNASLVQFCDGNCSPNIRWGTHCRRGHPIGHERNHPPTSPNSRRALASWVAHILSWFPFVIAVAGGFLFVCFFFLGFCLHHCWWWVCSLCCSFKTAKRRWHVQLFYDNFNDLSFTRTCYHEPLPLVHCRPSHPKSNGLFWNPKMCFGAIPRGHAHSDLLHTCLPNDRCQQTELVPHLSRDPLPPKPKLHAGGRTKCWTSEKMTMNQGWEKARLCCLSITIGCKGRCWWMTANIMEINRSRSTYDMRSCGKSFVI